jgi:putative oxidoreductase
MLGKLEMLARVVLGAAFVVFGLNFFFHFLPLPPLPEKAMAFMGALVNSGYLMTVVKVLEIVFGAFLLLGVFVPLSLLVLAPIIVNIFLFHIFLAPDGAAMGIILLALGLFIGIANISSFKPLLRAK